MITKQTGIYIIINLINNKVYIGQTMCKKGIARRFTGHRCELRGGYHHNKHLQNSWNKYGEENFEFEALEIVEDKTLIDERERYWISFYDSTNPKKGYNKESGGCAGKTHSEETKKILSEKTRGENSPCAKLTDECVKQIKAMLVNGVSPTEIADNLNMKYSTIEGIKAVKNWTHISPELNGILRDSIKENLTEDEVKTIKILLSQGKTIKEVSAITNNNRSTICNIKNLIRWKQVLPELNDKILKSNPKIYSLDFSDEELDEIRRERSEGKTIEELTKKWNVGRGTIWRIVYYKNKYSKPNNA